MCFLLWEPRSVEPRVLEGEDGAPKNGVPAGVQEQVRHSDVALHQLPERSFGGMGRRGRRLGLQYVSPVGEMLQEVRLDSLSVTQKSCDGIGRQLHRQARLVFCQWCPSPLVRAAGICRLLRCSPHYPGAAIRRHFSCAWIVSRIRTMPLMANLSLSSHDLNKRRMDSVIFRSAPPLVDFLSGEIVVAY